MAIEKCKKFLTAVQSSNFQCKIFINSWEVTGNFLFIITSENWIVCKDIEGRSNFEKIVTNMGAQLKLPKEDVEGIKLAAMGGCTKRDYLAFDCAIKDKGEVRWSLKALLQNFNFYSWFFRLHTGGYSVVKKDEDTYDFQIVHHFIDLNELTLKKLPVS